MKIFLRLLSYLKPYRYRYGLGVLVSFFVAVLSGLSLSVFTPFFEIIGSGGEIDPYLMSFKKRERDLLQKALNLSSYSVPIKIPLAPQSLGQSLSENVLKALSSENRAKRKLGEKARMEELGLFEKLKLQTIIYAKLKVNASGFSFMRILFSVVIFVLLLWSLKLLLILVSVRLISRSGYLAVRDIRDALYLKIQGLGLTWFYRNKSGELVSRLSSDAEIVATVISENLRDTITNFFYVIIYLLILFYLNMKLFLIIFALLLFLSPFLLFMRKRIRKAIDRSQSLVADLHGHVQESISGMKLIRFMQMEDYETQRFQKINDRIYWGRFKEILYDKAVPYFSEFNSVIVILALLSLGAVFLESSDFSSSDFMVFLVTLSFIMRPTNQIFSMYAKIQGAIAAGMRIFQIMDKKFEDQDSPQPIAFQALKKNIQFKDICFSYPESERQVLHNINLEVPVGATVALVGESGGGKSTLMDLLVRFFRPSSGQILFDGEDIQNFRILEHRSRIGIVTQDIFLFHGNVYDNIAYGKENAKAKEVEQAARLAHAHDFIKSMPKAYKSPVGNHGLNFSGGQRQRIAIARALLRDPEILILDEATSALDAQSEKLVHKGMERLFRNRTTFIIAHRLSTVEKADIIIVIEEGKIVEYGNHRSLLKKAGYYAALQKLNRDQQFLFPTRRITRYLEELISLGQRILSPKRRL